MRQLRKKAKELSERVRKGDADAASELLQHSVRLGHSKLALRRFLLANAMGAEIADNDLQYCASVYAQLPRSVSEAMAEDEKRKAMLYLNRKKSNG